MEANQITSFKIKKCIHCNSFNSLNFYTCALPNHEMTEDTRYLAISLITNLFWYFENIGLFYMQPSMRIQSTKFAPFFFFTKFYYIYYTLRSPRNCLKLSQGSTLDENILPNQVFVPEISPLILYFFKMGFGAVTLSLKSKQQFISSYLLSSVIIFSILDDPQLTISKISEGIFSTEDK